MFLVPEISVSRMAFDACAGLRVEKRVCRNGSAKQDSDVMVLLSLPSHRMPLGEKWGPGDRI